MAVGAPIRGRYTALSPQGTRKGFEAGIPSQTAADIDFRLQLRPARAILPSHGMQLDVQRSHGQVVRLHDFDHGDLQRLRELLSMLASAARPSVALHEAPFIRPMLGCRLLLQRGQENQGIQPATDPNLFGWATEPGTWDPFVCTLTLTGWNGVIAGVDLLLRLRFLCSEHVWLHRQWDGGSEVAWLLSPDGDW